MNDPQLVELFEEFPELCAENVILEKEVLAHFGLVFSGYALLEAALQNCYVFWQLQELHLAGRVSSENAWQASYDALEEKAFGSTFGSLLVLLSGCSQLSRSLPELRSLKKSRDFFAHHFFREENGNMFSDEGALGLILGMSQLRHRVKEAEVMVDAVAHRFFKSMYPNINLDAKLAETADQLKSDAIANPCKTFGWAAKY